MRFTRSFGFFGALFFLLVHNSRGDAVSYVYSESCTYSPGCSFTDDIWNTTQPITSLDDVIIESNVSIIITIYNTSISFASLTFGVDGAHVVFQVMNSSVTITGDTSLPSALRYGALYWGLGSELALYSSHFTIEKPEGVQQLGGNGHTMTAYYSTFSTIDLEVINLTAAYSTISADGVLLLNFTVAQFSSFHCFELNVDTLYSYSNELGTVNMAVSDYAIIFNNTGFGLGPNTYKTSFTLEQNVYMEVYNTILILDSITINAGGFFTFQADNEDNMIAISQIEADYGSEVNLGNNVFAFFQDGSVSNLTLGENVTMEISSICGMDFHNIQHIQYGSHVNITILSGEVGIWTQSVNPLNASIYVYSAFAPAILAVRNELYLVPGNEIRGNGMVYIAGVVNCSKIFIHTVQIALDQTLIAVDTLTAALIYPDYVGDSPVIATGNVIIKPTYPWDGVKFSEMFLLTILGNFTQIGGHMNFSVHDKHNESYAYLNIYGTAIIHNVTLGVVTDAQVVLPDDRWFLVHASNLSLENMNITDLNHSFKYSSYYIIGENELFLAYNVPVSPEGGIFTELQYFFIFGGGIVLVVVFVGIVAVVQNRKSRRRDYEPL